MNENASPKPIPASEVASVDLPEAPAPWWKTYANNGNQHIEVISLTPAMAKELLGINDHNRVMNVGRRSTLADAIARGEWVTNNDAITIGADGRLLNGQHRCGAIVDAGIAVPVAVMFNADPASQDVMDQGVRRSFGDVLHLRGEPHAQRISAVVKNVFWWEIDGIPVGQNRQFQPTVPQLLAVLDRHPGVRTSVVQIGERQPLLTQSLAAVHHYVFSMVDSDDADMFFELLGTGDGLKAGDPIHTLRERLLREKAKPTGHLRTWVKSAFIHRAWHAWRAGTKLSKLVFRAGGARPDRFPVVTLDEE